MKLGTRWVSSQILLLVIAGWVSGLAVIHHLWLAPSIKSQMARQESSVAVRWVEQSLNGLVRERKALAQWGQEWVRAHHAADILANEADQTSTPAIVASLESAGLVLCDKDHRVVATFGWVTETSRARPVPPWVAGENAADGPMFPPDWDSPRLTGLLGANGRVCLFAREPVGEPDDPIGYAVFVRPIDYPLLKDLSMITGMEVVVSDSLKPGGGNDEDVERLNHWSSGHGTLAADMNLKDTLGRPIGRLQVAGSVSDIGNSADRVRSAYVVQLLWLIVSALVTFGVVYLIFIRPLAILVRRLSDSQVTEKRERLPVGLFAETGIVARKFAGVLDHIVRLSETDALTGLTNRRQFQILLDHAFHGSRRHGQPLTVIMMDIDHFKRINDRHGHLAGDEVLREVAQNIRTVCRRSDVCARFGGEEFAVILPQTSAEQGIVLAERLREQMMQARIELDGRELTVTISLGVATMPPVLAHRCEDLVDQADQALYCAKHAGRNRTVVAGEEPDPLPGAEPSPVPSDGRPAIA